jgi:glycosyltransferase involved in cell wall biosynthesis
MADRLQRAYLLAGRIHILSNAGFIGGGVGNRLPPGPPLKVGFLSNLSNAKGLDDFIGLAEASAARGLPWRFVMAGPFENGRTRHVYAPRLGALPNLEYIGPVYAEAKSAFLQGIDIFVFPTRYRNEAEPLVILEALSHGRPVIAFDRGCIAGMLGDGAGKVVPAGHEFVVPALGCMEAWRADTDEFRKKCLAAQLRFAELQAESARAFESLLSEAGMGPT